MISKSRSAESTIGIASVGYYIPKGVMTAEEMSESSGVPLHVFHEKLGLLRKHVAGEDEHPADMGIRAAGEALRKAGIAPEELSVVVHCGGGLYEYQIWSPAAKIQGAIGAKNAYAFEIRNGCNSGNLGLALCKNILLSDPEKKYALVVASDKLSITVDYTNPGNISVFNAADGAAAAVLARREPTNRLLAYASISDGTLSDYVKLPAGGTKIPPYREDIEKKDCYIAIQNAEELDRIFSDTYLNNYIRTINEALQKSGHSVLEIDHLFTNQVKRSLSRSIFASLNLTEEHTITTMREYGHMGPVDTLFALGLALEERRIIPGDLVVLASSGTGFTWGATVIEY